MDIKDLNEFRSEFEAMQKMAAEESCEDGSCASEEREDYPDYVIAMYSEVMPPVKSGIYFSRWDLKAMAAEIEESFALDVRERMFKNFMQWVSSPEDMQLVMDQFKKNIDMKCDLYRGYSKKYPATKSIYDKKIKKADATKKYLDTVYVEFFT